MHLTKKSGLLRYRKTGLFQKMRTFAFSQKSTFPKNQDFHQKSLHLRVLILSKLVYNRWSGSFFYLTLQKSPNDKKLRPSVILEFTLSHLPITYIFDFPSGPKMLKYFTWFIMTRWNYWNIIINWLIR